MPELPEVEVTKQGVYPHIINKKIGGVTIRHYQLRWPVSEDLPRCATGQIVLGVRRRAKYLLLQLKTGIILIHLGMSGSLRFLTRFSEPAKHDHLDIMFTDGSLLRFRDPRRFGAVLWFTEAIDQHPLLSKLGPEPLDAKFSGEYLFDRLKNQRRAIKLAIMDNVIVVGVGNIYANEALFRAKIFPGCAANQISLEQCQNLVKQIKEVLATAIQMGGSTLRDFVDSDGKAGYFQQTYAVYGLQNQPCPVCGAMIAMLKLGQRSSFYCPSCQK